MRVGRRVMNVKMEGKNKTKKATLDMQFTELKKDNLIL